MTAKNARKLTHEAIRAAEAPPDAADRLHRELIEAVADTARVGSFATSYSPVPGQYDGAARADAIRRLRGAGFEVEERAGRGTINVSWDRPAENTAKENE